MHTSFDWNTLYLTCFGVGLVLTVLAFVSGVGHFHIGHLHMGHGHGHFGKGLTSGHGISPFNGFTIVAFLCWFGGSGYLLHRYSPFVAPLVLGFALVSGVAGGSLIFSFMAKVLLPLERTLDAADTEMTGVIGKLSGAVPALGVGEIVFSQNGSRRSCAVRSDDESAIERNTEVIVMRYERGIAYVRRWDEFEGGLLGAEHASQLEDGSPKSSSNRGCED
jgi:hypothetical protein